ncbi:terminase small subunit [Gracilimonas sp.]|uniref:terminase small subunit n=1 Tax=Gracilimonas sp. TaxID=1974203 RepID=UPI0028716DF6|nr:terminase small subunit [Gracilimonas sp.]
MAAPKGNKFAIGNSGKPKKWQTVEELQSDIADYFQECDENKRLTFVKSIGEEIEVSMPLPYTIEGLAEALDCDRDTLLNYQKQEGYEEYFGTIKRAKMKIQRNKVERGLMGVAPSSTTIFDLKNNHGYVDKTIQDLQSSDGSMSPPKTLAELYDEERQSSNS